MFNINIRVFILTQYLIAVATQIAHLISDNMNLRRKENYCLHVDMKTVFEPLSLPFLEQWFIPLLAVLAGRPPFITVA